MAVHKNGRRRSRRGNRGPQESVRRALQTKEMHFACRCPKEAVAVDRNYRVNGEGSRNRCKQVKVQDQDERIGKERRVRYDHPPLKLPV